MTPELERACVRAVHVVTCQGDTLSAGRATLFILGELGWRRTAAVLRLPPFIWFVELGYRLVADHRPFFDRFLFRSG